MVESTLKHDHITAKAYATPESARAAPLDDERTTIDLESPEGRSKTLDLWVKIATERDSEWRRRRTSNLLKKPLREQKGGLKAVSDNVAGTGDDRDNQQCSHGKSSEKL
ncbi:hypothetical protein BHE74_00017029 [Ensete ventricosum]|nr:hypothetical protein GW17_00056445 [Ensete ventricosum]RWW74974.1 hypothetical protein BHE74_00017029 [Ensete ventricosum]